MTEPFGQALAKKLGTDYMGMQKYIAGKQVEFCFGKPPGTGYLEKGSRCIHMIGSCCAKSRFPLPLEKDYCEEAEYGENEV